MRKGSNEVVHIIQDEVIPTKAAIHKLSALKKERKSSDAEVQSYALKTRHLFFAHSDDAAEHGLHNAHLHTIQNHDGTTGDVYFNKFIQSKR